MESFDPSKHIELMKIIDPRIHISCSRTFDIVIGGLNITVQQVTPSSNSTTLTYAVTSPSPQTILCRRMYIAYTVQLSDSNASAGAYPNPNSQAPFNDLLEGPRTPFPLHSSATNVNFSLNGISNSWLPDVIVGPLTQYDCFSDTTLECGCPQIQPRNLVLPFNLNNAGTAVLNPPLPNNVGADAPGYYPFYCNEYARQFEHPDFTLGCRSANVFNYNCNYTQVAAAAGIFSVSYSAVEPVIVPPFVHSNDSLVAGMIGVNQFNLQYNLVPARFWRSSVLDVTGAATTFAPRSMVAGGTFNSPTAPYAPVTTTNLFASGPVLTMFFITPQPDYVIPPIVSYPIFEIVRYSSYSTPLTAVPPGGTTKISSPVLSLQTVPNRFYVFCKQNTAGQTLTNTYPYGTAYNSCAYNETCACIQDINITFNNVSGILSSATIQDLYYLSKKNGLKLSFPEFTGNSFSGNSAAIYTPSKIPLMYNCSYGSVICLESVDIGLGPTIAASLNGVFNMLVTVTIFNQYANPVAAAPSIPNLAAEFCPPGVNNNVPSQALQYQLFVVVVNSGILQYDCSSGQWNKLIGNLTSQEILSAPVCPEDLFKKDKNMYGGRRKMGGGFFDDFMKGVKQGLGYAKQALPIVSGIAGLIPHPAAQGIAKSADITNGLLGSVGLGKPRAKRARRRVGGAALSRNDLL